jgi:hypothetical protein
MTEFTPPIEVTQPKVLEVRYAGLPAIREIRSTGPDLEAVNSINNKASADEFEEVGNETREQTTAWLRGGTTRKFDSINHATHRRVAIGAVKDELPVSDEIIIANTRNSSELDGYSYFYKSDDFGHLTEELKKKYAAEIVKDVSFVTETPDNVRDPEMISQYLMSSSMVMWERTLGRSAAEFTGEMTPEQMKEAQSKLTLLANAGVDEDEENYRKALGLAGFTEVNRYTEDGEEYISHVLTVDTLLQKMKEMKSKVAPASTSTNS